MRTTHDRWLEKFQEWSEFLDPTIRFRREKDWLEDPDLAKKWSESELPAFRTNSIVYFGMMLFAYLAHACTDWIAHKPNISNWMAYRFGCAAAALLGLLYTNSRMFQLARSPRLPLALIGLGFVFMQGQSMVWAKGWTPGVPSYFCAALAVIATSTLRLSVKHSAMYLLLSYMVAFNGYLAVASDQIIIIFSASTVGLIAVVIQRARMSSDVGLLIANARIRNTQLTLIAHQRELAEHLVTWIPKEHWRRVCESRQKDGKTMLQALDDVLRVQKRCATITITDVRGFTQFTKMYPEQVAKLMQGQKSHTDLIADFHGIPEVIADCIFTYFDLEPAAQSFRNALLCSFEITQKNLEMNKELPEDLQIRRYIVVSFGLAEVGNHGGAFGSRKITAIGNCCNLLQRVDEASKSPKFSEFLSTPALVLTKDAAEVLLNLCPDIKCQVANLDKLGVIIRDFPEQRSLFFLEVNQTNYDLLAKSSDILFAERFIEFNYEKALEQIRRDVA